MSSRVQLLDKKFKPYLSEAEIEKGIEQVAEKINKNFAGKNPIFMCVLNGAFMFASDLLKKITIDCEVTFVKVASYQGTQSTENVKTLIGLNHPINEREVIIVEDIVDTGNTVIDLIDQIKKHGPEDIHVATLLFKPEAYTKDIPIDYVALKVPNKFLVGYGLDYNELGRNLSSIYVLDETNEELKTNTTEQVSAN